MAAKYFIKPERITIEEIARVIESGQLVGLSRLSAKKINNCRNYLEGKLTEDVTYYGINTGFGSLCDVIISKDDLEKLQYNLVVSHACGCGPEVPAEMVKWMILLKVQSLSQGHSGIRIETVQRLLDLYNENVLPVIYESGSLGASGDLAPLAHLSLPLIGLGDVNENGRKKSTAAAMKNRKWQPLHLGPKEGLALLNGTQFMSAYGSYLLYNAQKLLDKADLVAAMSLDAFDCLLAPFDALIHKIRPFKGQIESAKNIRRFLKGSKIAGQKKTQIQDPYSFRCIPQVHGASRDVVSQVMETVTCEINSVTDNPLIFAEEDKILSGGNFHGQPLALSLDYLALALSEIGNISERRTYFLLSGYRTLPPFLIDNAGLNSGLMIPQYTAASLVNQNKQLCTPASIDSIDSSNRQEDHVSMGANAATKCYRVFENVQKILAIELLTAAQALDFRKPLKSSTLINKLKNDYRKKVSFLSTDRPLYKDIANSTEFLLALNIK